MPDQGERLDGGLAARPGGGRPSVGHGAAGAPRHGRPRRRGRAGRVVALAVTVVVLFAGSAVAALGHRLQSNLHTADIGALIGPPASPRAAGSAPATQGPVDPGAGQAVNLLVLGSDQRDGQNGVIGGAEDTMASDTAIVVHLAADRGRVELVSIPRDSMVAIPECRASNGTTTEPRTLEMFNEAFAIGWAAGGDIASAAACTARTVQAATGLTLDHVVVVDFVGFQAMVAAIDGVDICIPRELDDPRYTGLHLRPGQQRLDAVQALQLARARHGNIGNGGDLARIGNQQRLIAAIVQKALSADVLANPVRLTAFLEAATSSLTVDEELDLLGMTGLAYGLRSVRAGDVTLVTIPTAEWSKNRNRLVWAPAAADVWANLLADRPIVGPDGAVAPGPWDADPAPPPGPGVPPSSSGAVPGASPGPVRTREAGVEPFTPADVTAVCG